MPAPQAKRHLAGRLVLATIALCAAAGMWAATIGVPENAGPWGLSAALSADERGLYEDLADVIVAPAVVPLANRIAPRHPARRSDERRRFERAG